jgi:predicted component of type VI protein secretion system
VNRSKPGQDTLQQNKGKVGVLTQYRNTSSASWRKGLKADCGQAAAGGRN